MSGQPSTPASPSVRAWSWITRPSRATLIVASLLAIAAVIATRWYLCHLVPVYLWSKDATTYSWTVWVWLDTGDWMVDPRRGSIYSALIAFCLKLWGNYWPVVISQHILGGIAVLVCIVILYRLAGPRAWLPVAFCAWAIASYSVVLHLEHLVRNETLIFFFATGTLAAWFVAIRRESLVCLAIAGICLSLLTMTKNLFTPLPLVVLVVHAWYWRRKLPKAFAQIAVFLAAMALPVVANKVFEKKVAKTQPPEPQEWLLLYARVAQFTVIDGGIEPEIKALIRDDIIAYNQRPKLDNNIILHRTAVPKMGDYLTEHGKTPTDLNKLCRALAFEAIKAHPGEYVHQVLGDFYRLHASTGERSYRPDVDQIDDSLRFYGTLKVEHPTLHVAETKAVLETLRDEKHFKGYERLADSSWMFRRSPVLFTSLLLPFMWWRARGPMRGWWLGLAAVWFFNMVLLSTVGKPMDRYLIGVVPVMFWTMGGAIALAWNALTVYLERKQPALVAQPA